MTRYIGMAKLLLFLMKNDNENKNSLRLRTPKFGQKFVLSQIQRKGRKMTKKAAMC